MKTLKIISLVVFILVVFMSITNIDGRAFAAPKDFIDLRVDPALPEKFNKQIMNSLKRVFRYYKQLGWNPVKPMIVTISQNPDFLVDYRNGAKRKAPYDADRLKKARQHCDTDHIFAGWANPIALHFCINKNLDVNTTLSTVQTFSIEASLAHEMRHVIHFELAAHKYKNGHGYWFGPTWLLEGDANLFTLEYLKKERGWEGTVENWVISKAREVPDRYTLIDFETYGEHGSIEYVYLLGQLGTWMLREAFGQDKINEHFRQLRRGAGPNGTFLNVFGIPLLEFSDTVKRLDGDKIKIHQWINSQK